MAQCSSYSVAHSGILTSSTPNIEADDASNLIVKETMDTSPVPSIPDCSPCSSFEASMDPSDCVRPVSNNIFPTEINMTADSTITHLCSDLTNTYCQFNINPACSLNLDFQETPDLDTVCSFSDISESISNTRSLSSSLAELQNVPLICNCSPGKSDHQITSKCEISNGSGENKVHMQQDRQLCEQFLDSLTRMEDWLQVTKIAASLQKPSGILHKEAKLALTKYEVLLKEIRDKLVDLDMLNRKYWRITQITQHILLPTTLRRRMQEVNHFWEHLQKEAETIYQNLKSKVQQREEFDTDQDDVKLSLTEMDMELSCVEYIHNGNSTEKIQQLKAFQEDVWNNMKRVEGLLDRGDQLIFESDPQDALPLEEEMTELGSYCQEIFIRLSRLQKRLVSTKLVFEDDVLDSGFEHVSSGSSDVFLDLDYEDEEVPGLPIVPHAKAAFDLEWDPMGDVGSSGSYDDILRSPCQRISRRNKYSESSVSTDSGVTNFNHRSQEEFLPEEEDLHIFISSRSTDILEGFQRPEMDIQEQTVLCNGLSSLEPGDVEVSSYCVSSPVDTLDSGHRTNNHLKAPQHDCSRTHWRAPVASKTQVTESHIQHNIPGQRKKQGKKKKVTHIQEFKRKHQPTRPEVSILMDNRDGVANLKSYKPLYGCLGSLWLPVKRLTFLSLVFLLLCGSLLLFPISHSRCLSQRFSWTLMLTYVNGPPPT